MGKASRMKRERKEQQNEVGMFGEIPPEIMNSVKRKAPLYRTGQFGQDKMERALFRYQAEASLMGGGIRSPQDYLNRRGCLLPFLLAYDELFWGRWDYWLDIVDRGTVEGSGPIPQIEWCKNDDMTHQVRKMLMDCVNYGVSRGATIDHFADWLLWGLGRGDFPPVIYDDVNEFWYKRFDLALVLQYPTDYMSRVLEELSSTGYKQALGYFATPYQVCQLMTELTVSGRDPEKMKTESVYEGCCGCGALFLPMSNYSLFGYAQDKSAIAVKLCSLQCIWYAPWFAFNPLK